jgi:hypothetical protein
MKVGLATFANKTAPLPKRNGAFKSKKCITSYAEAASTALSSEYPDFTSSLYFAFPLKAVAD